MLARVIGLVVVVCPSVGTSHAGIVSKWHLGGDGSTSDVHGTHGMHQTPLVRFVVDKLIGLQQVVQQIEPMEFEPIQPMTTADTRRGAVYTAQWLTGGESSRG